MTILVVCAQPPPLRVREVEAVLLERGHRLLFLHPSEFPDPARLSLRYGPGIHLGLHDHLDLGSVDAIWKQGGSLRIPEGLDAELTHAVGQENSALFNGILACVPAFWLDDPWTTVQAAGSLLQRRLAWELGLPLAGHDKKVCQHVAVIGSRLFPEPPPTLAAALQRWLDALGVQAGTVLLGHRAEPEAPPGADATSAELGLIRLIPGEWAADVDVPPAWIADVLTGLARRGGAA